MSARKPRRPANVVSLAEYRQRHAVEEEESIIEMLNDLAVIWGKFAKLRSERRPEVLRLAGEAAGRAWRTGKAKGPPVA